MKDDVRPPDPKLQRSLAVAKAAGDMERIAMIHARIVDGAEPSNEDFNAQVGTAIAEASLALGRALNTRAA